MTRQLTIFPLITFCKNQILALNTSRFFRNYISLQKTRPLKSHIKHLFLQKHRHIMRNSEFYVARTDVSVNDFICRRRFICFYKSVQRFCRGISRFHFHGNYFPVFSIRNSSSLESSGL